MNILTDPCAVMCAEIRILYRHLDVILCLIHLTFYLMIRFVEGKIVGCRRLSCNSKDRITVHAVGGDFKFEERIVQSERRNAFGSRLYPAICLKDLQPVLRFFRVKITTAPQFFDGAHHTVGFHPSQLPGLNGDPLLL